MGPGKLLTRQINQRCWPLILVHSIRSQAVSYTHLDVYKRQAVTIEQDGTPLRDPFYAVNNWRDTIYNGPYAIYLNLVKPETRPTTDPIDPDSYSFEMVIK